MEKLNQKKFEKYTVNSDKMEGVIGGAASRSCWYWTQATSTTGSSAHDWDLDWFDDTAKPISPR